MNSLLAVLTSLFLVTTIVSSGLAGYFYLQTQAPKATKARGMPVPTEGKSLEKEVIVERTDKEKPVVVFEPAGSFPETLKADFIARMVDPYVDYNFGLSSQETKYLPIVIMIEVNNIPETKKTYPYLFTAISRAGTVTGVAVRLTDGRPDWWVPECLGPCPFNESFKTAYPEIVKLASGGK